MKEKLQTLPVSEIRALAREKGIPELYSKRKAELIDALVSLYEEEQKTSDAEKKPEEKTEQTVNTEQTTRENTERKTFRLRKHLKNPP